MPTPARDPAPPAPPAPNRRDPGAGSPASDAAPDSAPRSAPQPSAPGARALRAALHSRELSLFLIIVAAFAVLWVLKGNVFFSLKNFEGILTGITYDLLMAAGMTVVLILWGIDLSVGAVLALTSVIIAMLLRSGVGIPLSVVIGVACAMGIGLLNGAIVAHLKITPFIVTLAAMSVARGAALVLSSGYFVSGLPPAYAKISEGRVGGFPVSYLLVAAVLIILQVLLSRLKFLNQAFYVGTNPRAAVLSGMNANRVTLVGYVISALMAGLAAVLMSSKLAMGFSQFGQLAEMRAIAAAVIGGASFTGGSGSVLGAALGVFLIAIINNGFVLLHGSPNWQQAVSGFILLVAVGVDAVRTRRERRE